MKGIPREKRSDLEQRFLTTWKLRQFPTAPVREHQFYADRNWRFDFAWPAELVAVEIEGGTASGTSRHTSGVGFQLDTEKYNVAACLGWHLLRFTAKDLRVRPVVVVDLVIAAIARRRAEASGQFSTDVSRSDQVIADYARKERRS